MSDEIRLDKKTFEALAMDSRVKILKALKVRRKTQSELSKELNLAVSTVSQHLDKLVDANLVKRKNQGKKWVYYELTTTAGGILSPSARGVFVFALSVSLLLIVLGSMTMYDTSTGLMYSAVPYSSERSSDSEIMSEEDITDIAGGAAGSPSYLPNVLVDGAEKGAETNHTTTDTYIATYVTEDTVNLDAFIVILMGLALLVGTITYKIKRK
jgi:DNA-binding transcriptional ArsR family regulator